MNNLATALVELGENTEAISYLYQAINAQPDFAYSYLHLAKLENSENALLVLRKGHQHLPDNSQLSLQLAFLLAASPKKELRNCSEALQLATNVSEKKQHQDAESLNVMSAAYACSGDFDRAIQTAQRAEQLATTNNLKKKIQTQLKHYFKKQIYHE
jgi:tetratricopeptide (TPR) repeat protein